MSVESKTQIKTYFETGDIPTEGQYSNFIDSTVFHPVQVDFDTEADVTVTSGLYVDKIIVWSETNSGVGLTVGSTEGGDEYYGGGITAGTPLEISIGRYIITGTHTIYVRGGVLAMSHKVFVQ